MNSKRRVTEENDRFLQLWLLSQQGDNTAFRSLADGLYRTLFNYAFNFTSDREFIKDTIQELFITIWAKKHRIHMEVVVLYFLKSLRNQLWQHFRRRGSSVHFYDISEYAELEEEEGNIEEIIVAEEVWAENEHRLQAALRELPKRQKEVVFLKYYEGMDNDRIAQIMQVNKQSVANLLFKAMQVLRSQMAARV